MLSQNINNSQVSFRWHLSRKCPETGRSFISKAKFGIILIFERILRKFFVHMSSSRRVFKFSFENRLCSGLCLLPVRSTDLFQLEFLTDIVKLHVNTRMHKRLNITTYSHILLTLFNLIREGCFGCTFHHNVWHNYKLIERSNKVNGLICIIWAKT